MAKAAPAAVAATGWSVASAAATRIPTRPRTIPWSCPAPHWETVSYVSHLIVQVLPYPRPCCIYELSLKHVHCITMRLSDVIRLH